MTTTYVQPSTPVDYACGNCANVLSFAPSIPIASDNEGAHYLINAHGDYLKLQVAEIHSDESLQPIQNKDIPDTISVQCPICAKFSHFAIALAIIVRYLNGTPDVTLTTTSTQGIHDLPIVLMQRLHDDSLLPLCIMDMSTTADE